MSEKLPRVWVRTEPYHEELLSKGEVVKTDISNHYARRGSHWIEFVHIDEFQEQLQAEREKVELLRDVVVKLLERKNEEHVRIGQKALAETEEK